MYFKYITGKHASNNLAIDVPITTNLEIPVKSIW
jgi:hypothetical protein